MKNNTNPYAARLEAFVDSVRSRKLDAAIVCNQANIRALTGVDCDNAAIAVEIRGGKASIKFFTDFRYVPMVHRVAPGLKVVDIKHLKVSGRKVGYEPTISHARFLKFQKDHPKAKFEEIDSEVKSLRAVKNEWEIAKLRAAEELNSDIWAEAQKAFKPGMTELEMARIIRHMMIERGEGEAFETIVCVGANAAECHHVPDSTVWNGREPVLVDMGVKLDGYCSDMTRNIVPAKPSKLYKDIYALVLKANMAAIAAAKPGLTCGRLDRVARKIIEDAGYGKCFGHSLGHGVGVEIHEAPAARKGDKTVLKPGMLVTIEPGVYLEGNLGVRIEDLILITETGCEVLSPSPK
jgi:Xaa-Pro aminopeptidase